MYAKCLKRLFDFFIALIAIAVLSPILLLLTLIGAVAMGGNPFFTQLRPGKNEKIFRLIKFRTMNNRRDADGKLLPDQNRLNGYGRFLRATSLDELPELFNILVGHMAIVGPRPLVPQYLPYYTDEERRRHSVRPGLTGLAQVNGRNALQWEERFAYDLKYVERITLWGDVKILFLTVTSVFKRRNVVVRGTGRVTDFDKYREEQRKAQMAGQEGEVK